MYLSSLGWQWVLVLKTLTNPFVKKGKKYIVLFNPALPKLTCYFKKFIPWEKENLDNTFSAKLLSEVAMITVVKNEIDSTYFPPHQLTRRESHSNWESFHFNLQTCSSSVNCGLRIFMSTTCFVACWLS